MNKKNSPLNATGPTQTPHRFALFLLLLFWGSAQAELQNNRWRWSNPLPHGNNVLDMIVTSDRAFQVGDAGSLYIQRSDERWAPVYTGVQNYLRSVTLLGNRIITTGENGCILWSDDGDSVLPATLKPANTLDWFEGVDASSSRAVAVGDYGTIYTSTSGTNWIAATSGTTEWLRGVSFGNDTFVAVGENGKILRSTNGISWTAVFSGTSEHLNRIRYLGNSGNRRFIAVGDNGTALQSITGNAPWVSLNSGTTNNLFDVAVNNSGILLAGDGELRISTDNGTSWSNHVNAAVSNAPPNWIYLSAHGTGDFWQVAGRTGLLMENRNNNDWNAFPSDSSHAWLWDLTVQDGLYVAVGDLATIQTSLDGILWASEAVPVERTNTVLLGVGGTSNLLIAAGNDGKILLSHAGLIDITITNQVEDETIITNITTETLGLIWTNPPAFTDSSLQGVAATDGLYILSGESGNIFTSPGGTNWTEQSTPTENFLTSVAIGPAACIASGANGTLLRSGPDGTSWVEVSLGTTNWLYRVRWVNGLFAVTGQNGSLYTSLDGLSWTPRDSGTTEWLTDITIIDQQWFITGYHGTLLTSTNLTDWSERPLPTGKSLFSAATENGQLVAAGVEGVILRNQIVSHTSSVNILGYHLNTTADPKSVLTTYETILFEGKPDQTFNFQSCNNLSSNQWETLAEFELFDPSGTIYLLRTRDATNTPPTEFYRTVLLP